MHCARILAPLLAIHVAACKGPSDVTTMPPPADEAGVTHRIVVLPDTQNYVRPENNVQRAAIFTSQTKWIRDNAARWKVAFALHVGDVTHRDTEAEWKLALESFGQLDGVVPLFFVPGNHDYEPGGATVTRETNVDRFLPLARIKSAPTFGGSFKPESSANTFHLVDAGGAHYLVLCLEFGPRDSVLAWADAVLKKHLDRQVIVLIHSYLREDDKLEVAGEVSSPDWYNFCRAPMEHCNVGNAIWEKLLKGNANVRLIVSGHRLGDGTGRLVQRGDHGNPVVALLSNYQMLDDGGKGYLRIMSFSDNGQRIHIKTYSPWMKAYLDTPENRFGVDLKNGVFFPG